MFWTGFRPRPCRAQWRAPGRCSCSPLTPAVRISRANAVGYFSGGGLYRSERLPRVHPVAVGRLRRQGP